MLFDYVCIYVLRKFKSYIRKHFLYHVSYRLVNTFALVYDGITHNNPFTDISNCVYAHVHDELPILHNLTMSNAVIKTRSVLECISECMMSSPFDCII